MKTRRSLVVLAMALLLIPALVWAQPGKGKEVSNSTATDGRETILEFKVVVGVDGPFLSSASIRRIISWPWPVASPWLNWATW